MGTMSEGFACLLVVAVNNTFQQTTSSSLPILPLQDTAKGHGPSLKSILADTLLAVGVTSLNVLQARLAQAEEEEMATARYTPSPEPTPAKQSYFNPKKILESSLPFLRSPFKTKPPSPTTPATPLPPEEADPSPEVQLEAQFEPFNRGVTPVLAVASPSPPRHTARGSIPTIEEVLAAASEKLSESADSSKAPSRRSRQPSKSATSRNARPSTRHASTKVSIATQHRPVIVTNVALDLDAEASPLSPETLRPDDSASMAHGRFGGSARQLNNVGSYFDRGVRDGDMMSKPDFIDPNPLSDHPNPYLDRPPNEHARHTPAEGLLDPNVDRPPTEQTRRDSQGISMRSGVPYTDMATATETWERDFRLLVHPRFRD